MRSIAFGLLLGLIVQAGGGLAAASAAGTGAPEANGRTPAAGTRTPGAGTPTPAESIARLAGVDGAARFDAILALVASKEPGVDRMLQQARSTEPFLESSVGRAALEFVRLKRKKDGPGPARKPTPGGTNIILVSLDTVRADHLGCYGYHRKTSPAIDAIAMRGAVFERAVSPSSWTLPVHMSIFTSLYPSFHGVDRSGIRWNVSLSAGEKTMAEYLKESGYATATLMGSPFLVAKWGFGRGFDLYRQYPTDARAQSERAALWLQWHAHQVDRGLTRSSFFLFLHFMDAHIPYSVPAEFRKRFPIETSSGDGKAAGTSPCVPYRGPRFSAELDDARAQYDAEINYIDTHLGRLVQALEDLGWSESTIFILTADHGEEFGDHGETKHKATLYEEVVRVPLIVTWPRSIARGQRIAAPVTLLDILPTVLEATGREVPGRLQGISLLPFLRGPAAGASRALPASRDLFAELGPLGLEWEMPFHRKAVSSGSQKLIVTYAKEGGVTKELYDLAADPRERCNVYAERQADPAVRRLEERLGQFIRQGVDYRAANASEEGFEANEELLEQLRSLGYIQ
jgi:arylsulfatase A-like enzyme